MLGDAVDVLSGWLAATVLCRSRLPAWKQLQPLSYILLIRRTEEVPAHVRSHGGSAFARGGLMAEPQRTGEETGVSEYDDPCIRAENEDDDGYDPYSDRRPDPEPLFERDPWA